MFKINSYIDTFKIYELSNDTSNCIAKICPERGGMVTELKLNENDLLYLNKETFYNTSLSIRGGIPILFPISGQLVNGQYELNRQTYKMKNHGFARNSNWKVIETSATKTEASIKLSLESSEETKESFPFDFSIIFTYVLKDNSFYIYQEYYNDSQNKMPICAGFHPYFNAVNKNINYETDAHNYLDYNDNKIKTFSSPYNIVNCKESIVLLDSKESKISFKLNELNKKVTMEYGPEFRYAVIWTEKDKDFICVEPWMSKNQAFNTMEDLTYIEPQKGIKTFVSIGV